MYANPGEEPYEGNPYEYWPEEEQGTAADGTDQPVPPWEDYEPGISEAPPRRERPRNYAALETANEARAKMLHDRPPNCHGENADKLLKP